MHFYLLSPANYRIGREDLNPQSFLKKNLYSKNIL